MTIRTLCLALIGAGAVMLAGACSSTPQSGPPLGTAAPAMSATTSAGESFDLADKRGSVILIDFYANW